eukprot:m.178488 g.178488  ORF g.178488 m.178488 type:complete len:544 (+) comp14553_c0_seq1:220-1851(+)
MMQSMVKRRQCGDAHFSRRGLARRFGWHVSLALLVCVATHSGGWVAAAPLTNSNEAPRQLLQIRDTGRDHVVARDLMRQQAGYGGCDNDLAVGWCDQVEKGSREVCSVSSDDAAGGIGVVCLGHVRGGVQEAHCLARSLRLDAKAAAEWALGPGRHNPNKAGSPPELDVTQLGSMSRMPSACRGRMPPTGHGGQAFLRTLVDGSPDGQGGTCTITVRDPVLFLADKYGDVNPFHSMEDMIHSFTLMASMRFPIDHTRILVVDRPSTGPPPAVYMGMWDFGWEAMSGAGPVSSLSGLLLNATELASAVDVAAVTDSTLRGLLENHATTTSDQMRELWTTSASSHVLCFDKSTFSLHGGISLLSQHRSRSISNCRASPILLGFSDLIMSRVEGGDRMPLSYTMRDRNTRELTVLYVQRGGARTVSKGRRFTDPEGLKRSVSALAGIKLVTVSFDDLSKPEQLAHIRSADIFLSVHGAALTWAIFLPSTSAVVEIGPMHCHCFDNLAHWTDHPYEHVPSMSDVNAVTDAVRRVSSSVHDSIDVITK